MPETRELVINTGPVIALVAALGDLKILRDIYNRVVVPFEVCDEILAQSASHYGAKEFESANWLEKLKDPCKTNQFLQSTLDPGEAAVIQIALDKNIGVVCIDEDAGRRIARLNGLQITGSLGILIRAKREGHGISLSDAIPRMQERGIHLSHRVIKAALKLSGE